MHKGIVMFSGGLDSLCTTHLLLQQGIDLLAIHFVLPFTSNIGYKHTQVIESAKKLGVPLQIIEEGDEYIAMIKRRLYGFGKNANPCLDCRIHRFSIVKKMMLEMGASFIATGEVLGQRPMSQREDCFNIIERQAGLKGYILRPLCAKHLPPTVAETKGIINRENLLALHGRNRKPQIDYAKSYNLKFATPAGGCILTTIGTGKRFQEMEKFNPDFDLMDFKLLAYGRHFRLSNETKLVIARNESENRIFEMLSRECDCRLDLSDITGPIGLIKGQANQRDLEIAGSLLGRFSKGRDLSEVSIIVKSTNLETEIKVKPADEILCACLRI